MKRGHVLKVPKEKGEIVMRELKKEGNLDSDRIPLEKEGYLLIPVKEGGIGREELPERNEQLTPFENVVKILRKKGIPTEKVPRRWEKIGDVLLLKLPNSLKEHEKKIGKAYSDVLGVKTVLDQGPIKGVCREPEVRVIYGGSTETVHIENGVKYKLDVSCLMFSSGNIDERVRIAKVPEKGETIVDMFAGIGYFSLPMAVHSQPEKIYSLEINDTAYRYLKENTILNDVMDIVEPWNGDNRDFHKCGIADRVVMGYLHDTWRFLPKALKLIGDEGLIHYHTIVLDREFHTQIDRELTENIITDFEVIDVRKIKSYAPHVFHVVVDVKLG